MAEEEPIVQDNNGLFQHKDFLKERMDPDFGLLSKLRARNALSEEEIDEIKEQRPYRKRNMKIIDYILVKKKLRNLFDALKDSKQSHLANYVIANGEYKPEFGGEWPLGQKEVSTFDANEECLVDLLETCDLLSRLFSTGVINKRQMEFISSKPTSYEKNEELIKLMRRFSLSSYWQTIKSLHASNQSHIAAIFEKGGVLVQTAATLEAVGANIDTIEEQIVTGIANILGDRSLPESNRILELVQLRLVGAKVGHSVDLYFHCLDLKDVDRLQEICESGHMKNIIETVFTRLISTGGNIRVKVKWRADSFNQSRHFCKEFEATERSQRSSQVTPHETTVNDLPLELMDLILQKSYLSLVRIERQSPGCSQRQDLFSKMAKVDYCWFQRLRKRRFKRRIWSHLSEFYKDVDNFAVYRINQYYFVENIQATTVLINRLRSSECLTDVQARLISRDNCLKAKTKRDNKEVNEELLQIVRSFNTETRYSNFTRCLRQYNQNLVEKIAQNGGVVIKAKIVPRKSTKQEKMVQQLVQGLNDLETEIKSWPKNDQMEILNSFPDRQAVVWMWSRSQIAFENLRSLDEHEFVKLLSCLSKIPQSATGTIHAQIKRHNVDIDIDQFQKTIVLFPTVVNFKASLQVEDDEYVVGVTKLRREIYILYRSLSSKTVFRVFQDIYPFYLQGNIEIKTCKFPEDVVSSEKENCLYVIDTGYRCIWKITREFEDKYRVTKWLSIDIDWLSTLSVSRDDGLMIVRGCGPLSRLEIYGPDAKLLLSIHLPPEIEFPQHAVETSTGNFIILHECVEETETGAIYKWLIWEVTRNGKLVVRRYIPQNVEQELDFPRHLLIDSDDRLLVADTKNGRLHLLDSDLRWSGIPIYRKNHRPLRLCYDEANTQLIVTFELRGLCPRIYEFKCSRINRRLR